MRRGTRVGQAYVAVTADGSGINEEIVDAVDEAGPGVESAGERAGKRYGDRFSARFRERLDGMKDQVSDRLSKNFGDAGDESGDSFARRLKATLDRAGDQIGRSLGERIADSMSDRLELSIAGMIDMMDSAVSGNAGSSGSRGSSGRYGPPPAEVRRLEQAYRMDREFDRARHRMIETAYRMNERFDRQRLLMLEQAHRMNERFNAGRLSGDGRAIPLPRGGDRTLGDRIGVMLGAGSRSNILNLLGRSIGNVVNLAEKARQGVSALFSTFQRGFTSAAEGSSLLQKSLSGLSAVGSSAGGGLARMFSSLAASGPALAVALVVVAGAMSALVSVMGALLAMVTALSAALVSGLVGALAVAGAGILAVVAGAGLLTAAFMSMTDAQHELLATSFQPLKAEMVGIGQIMIQQMVPAFATWSQNLQQALYLAVPLAQGLGRAFAQAGTEITAALSGPGFQALATAFGTYLPSIITNLSAALGQFLNGVAGLFAAIMPYVNQFATYLNRVATEFSNWANSTEGQNAIVDFVDRALDSLESLWDFVGEFAGFIGDVLFSPDAQQAGNTMFDSLAKAFKDLRKEFAEAAADGRLKKWFEDAIEFGGDLRDAFVGIWDVLVAFYNSGVLDAIGNAISLIGKAFSAVSKGLGPFIDAVGKAANPLLALSDALVAAGKAVSWVQGLLGMSNDKPLGGFLRDLAENTVPRLPQGPFKPPTGYVNPNSIPSLPEVIDSGNKALNDTSESRGGYLPEPKEPKWKNPYVKWANSLIRSVEKMSTAVRSALEKANDDIASTINEIATSTDSGSVISALNRLTESLVESGERGVTSAQNALTQAAQRLANASSAKAAKKALKEVKAAQKDLDAALREQLLLQQVAERLAEQEVVNPAHVANLLQGFGFANATLADFAEARNQLAEKIQEANQKLEEAIRLRDSFAEQIAGSIKSFGALTNAQAQTINGVQQALTALDITTSLQDRLAKIKAFQDNLRLLLAQGISQDVYRQLIEAGVDGGAAYAEALVQGGPGAINEVNQLVDQINQAGDDLGQSAANRLYQAGVDSAQGLIDGLTSLESELASAAYRLGQIISWEIQRSLGIASPSKVLIGDMEHVGDGAVIGLDRQHAKVGSAAARLAEQIQVSPEVAAYASRQGQAPTVSGNGDPRFRDLIVHTPTEDPEAVAMEVLNEVTGAL